MRNLLSSLFFILIFVSLGVMAFAAAPQVIQTAAPAAEAYIRIDRSEIAATDVAYNWNAIALPLDTGVTLASELADYIDSSSTVVRAAAWQANPPSWVIWNPTNPRTSVDFTVGVGSAVMVAIDSSATYASAALVGDVPRQGAIQYELTPDAWNFIMVPLDQTGVFDDAESMANDIGGVDKVAYWNHGGYWVFWDRYNPRTSVNFSVTPGYPYMIKASSTTPLTWP